MQIKYKSKRRRPIRYYSCVIWARYKCRKRYKTKLPYGLFSLQDKIRIINSHKPKKGRYAIMNVGGCSGHIGFVTKVRGSKIYIEECNYFKWKRSIRKGREREFRILGYRK